MTIPVSIVRLFIFGVLLTAAALAVDNDALAHHTQTDTSNLFRVWCDEHYALVNIRSVPNAYSGGNRQRACRIPNRNRGQDFENCLRFPLPSGYGTPYLEGTANILPPDTPVCEVVIPDNVRGDELRDGYDASNRAQTNRPGGTLQAENIPGGIRVFGWTPPFSGNWPEYQLHRMDDQGVVIVFSHVADASSAGEAFDYGETLPLVAGVQYQFKIRPVASDGITFGDFSLPTPAQLEYAAIPARVVTVFISDSTNGTVSAEWAGDANLQNEGTVPAETNVTFTARPDDDFYVSGWSGDCESAGDTGDFAAPGAPQTCVRTAAMNVTVGAVFTQGLVCEGGLVIQDGECVVDSAGLYEHYFPAADRLSKCQALDGDQVVVDVRDPNAADPAANVAYFCNTRNVGDVCYLRKDGDYAAGIEGLRTHPGGFNFLDPVTHPPPPVCTDYAPPCYDEDDDLDHFQNPFTANCAGPPGSGPRATVFISTSANGTVSAEWSGDANLQNEGTVPPGTTVTFTATPDSDYEFSAWTGACQGEANPCALAVTVNATVGADFARSGEFTGVCALTEFPQSSRAIVSLQIAACEKQGWPVVEDLVDCVCDIKVRDASESSACLPSWRTSALGASETSRSEIGFYFGVSLQHLPQKTEDNKDACFVAKCPNGLEPSGFNMNGETECAAPPTASASVFISTSANGTVSAGWDEDSELQSGETVPAGTTVTFTAEPESGYGFSAWTGDCQGEANPCALEAAAAVTVGAEFVHTGEYTGACALANFSESARAGLSLRIDACVAKGWEVGEEFGLFCYCGIKVRNESSGALSCGVPRTNSRLPGVAANGNVYLAAYFGDSLEHLPQKTEANKDACFVAGCPGGKEPSGLNMHGETECRSPVNCGAENREQLSGTYVCGECLTGFEESGGACVQGAGCAGEGKQDGANPGECGGCLASHAADGDGNCHLRVDCAGLNKIQTNEHTCGDCLADFTEDDSELCRANADCAAAFKVQTNPYTCGACLPDHTQSGDNCIPDVDCAALFRVQATPGQCGNCLANYIPAPSGLACRPVAPPPPDSVSVFISTSTNGTVSAGWDGDANLQNEGTVPFGATVTFTATPAAGHAFSSWTGDCQGAANPCALEAAAAVTVGAVFAENCTKSLIDAAGGDLAQVECNLRAGADVNATGGNNNRSPLHWAVIGQQVEIIRLLLAAAGIDPNVRDGTYGSNPLIEAAFHGRAEIAGILANHHLVDLNIASNSGNRALHDAAGRGHLAVVNTLLAAGAAVNPQNNASRTPLGEAQNGGHGAIAARLIAAGGHYGTACHLLGGTVNPSAASPPCLGLPPLNLSAGALYEHYFPSSGRGAKCEGYSASAVGSALFANSSGTGAGAGYACRDAGSSICYLSHNNTPPNSLWRAGGHALNPATPECPAFRPPCLGASGQPDNARNPFAEACLGAVLPPLVSVVFAESPNGTVSAQWKFDPDLRGGEALPAGTTVTFTAEPEPDHEFSAWTDACEGEANPCVVPVTVNATVGAEFARTAAASVAVNYSKLPGGHESNGGTLAEADGRASGFQVAAGATVTFTAAPNPGWTVTWNPESGCDDNDLTCEVVAAADVNLTAIFGTGDDALLEKYFPGGGNQHCATVGGNTDDLSQPGSGGDVIGRECFGVSVGETACVQLGESFDPSRDIWNSNGDILNDYSSGIPPLCSQEYPPCDGAQVKPDDNPFAACVDPPPPPRQVSYSKLPGGHASNGGAVTVAGQERDAPFEVASDATVTFTAAPNPGWTVTWNDESGCDDEELTCEVIASGDLKVTAIFDAGNDALLEEYFPAADPNQHCQILGGHISYTVVDSGSAPFTVVGRLCARQFGFSVDCMQLGNAHDPVRRARDGDEIDLLDPYPPLCSEEYPPCDGPGETKPGENPFAACVAPPAVVSVFITPSSGGAVSARWGGNPDLQNEETVPFGTQVTFAAEPDPGHAFANWTGDCQGRPNPCVREANSDLTVGATFPLLVTISRDRPDNAELSAVLPPDADPLPTLLVTFADLPVRFTADPAPGHFIAEWQGVPPGQSCPPPGDVGQAQTCEITPAANLHIAVVARLARRLFYSHSPGGTVRAEDSENRTVPDRGEIRDRFRLVATPDPGFFIALWRADGADGAETCPAGIAADSAQTCPLQAQSRNAHAYVKFQPARRVSVAAAENGTVAARDHPDPAQGRDLSGGGLIPDGATLHLTATPDDGHFIFEWLGAPEDNACPKGQAVTVATECAFPVRRDLEVGAVFAPVPGSGGGGQLVSEAYVRANCPDIQSAVRNIENSSGEAIGVPCDLVAGGHFDGNTCYAFGPDHAGTPRDEIYLFGISLDSGHDAVKLVKSCDERLFCARRGIAPIDGNWFNESPNNCPLASHQVTLVRTLGGLLGLFESDGSTDIGVPGEGGEVEVRSSVVFRAGPDGGFYISKWNGLDADCPVGFSTRRSADPNAPDLDFDCRVQVLGPLTVSVSFARTPAAVSVLYSHSSGGTLRASVSAGSLSSGGTVGLLATVDFSAVADSGFYVSGWVGAEVSHCASGVGATLVSCRAEAVRHPLEVRADFAAEAVFHRVDFSASSGGTLRVLDLLARRVVSGSQPGVLSGSLLRLDADADSGFHLFGWGGWSGASSCARGVFTVSEVCEVRAESPLAVRAEFRRFHRADFSAGGAGGGVGGTGGTVSAVDFRGESVSSGGRVSGGTTVTFTAVPAAEHQVGAWVGIGASACGSGPAAISATECPVRVDGDLEVRAVFSPRARSSVSYSHSGGGTVSAADAAGRALPPRGGSVLQGATVTFTATPDAAAGRHVSSWSGIGGASCASGFSATLATRCAVAADSHLAVSVLFGILPGPGLLAEIQKPAGTGDAAAALRHLQAGADPDLRGGAENLPAVILAGVNGHAEIVSVLVTFGADADAAGANDWTLPFYLAMNGVDNSGASPTVPWATALEVLEHFDSALLLAAGPLAEFDWAGVDSSNGHPALAHLDYRHANWITTDADRNAAEGVGDFLYWRSRSADEAGGTAPTDAEIQCGSYANTEERRTSRICRGPALAPNAAEDFSAVLVSLETRTTISLSWDAPDYNLWTVEGYTIWRVDASPSSGTTDCAGLAYPDFSAGSTFTHGANATTALNDVGSAGYGKCFKYAIAAENVAGGGATTESDGVYVQGLPDAPFGVSATMIAAAGGFGSAISISWSPPATLRGAVIRAYEILREEEVGGETSLVLIGETAGTTFIDSSFPRGAMIRYAVRARSSAGGFRPPDGGGSPPVTDPVSDSSPPLETPQAARDADADEAVSPENRERTLRAVAGYFGFGHAIPVGNGYGLEQETFAGFDYDRAAEVISIRADNPVRADADLVLALTALAVCADCNPAELTVTIRFSPVVAPTQASLIAAYDSNFAHPISLPSGFESGGTLAIVADASGGFGLNGSGMLVRDSALTLTPGIYEISLAYSHADFLGTLALEVGAEVGPDCAGEMRLVSSANPLACGECDSGYGELNGHCVPADGNVEDDAEMCGTIFLGDYEAVLDDEGAVIGGVCSGIDINDTFCFLGSADALPCQGLFIHVRDCNLKHNRPALDPWHCGKACADGKSAVGARCVSPSE